MYFGIMIEVQYHRVRQFSITDDCQFFSVYKYACMQGATYDIDMLSLDQWSPDHVPQHTGVPPEIFKCAVNNFGVLEKHCFNVKTSQADE